MSTSASDYAALAASKYEVKLPSGAVFQIRQPNTFWFASNTSALPTSAIAAANGDTPSLRDASPDEIKTNVELTERLVVAHVLSPKIRRGAVVSKGEVDIDNILPDDAKFIIDYLLGRVDKDGNTVATFSGKQ